MKKQIINRLLELETRHNIRVLYACESGSRTWGFASPNSDWDVRFIYIHEQDWYLSIDKRKDMMDFAIDENELDLTGWELQKTLRLFSGSNASPYEWLQSPVVYHEISNFRERLWNLRTYFRPRSSAFHYLGLAKSSAKKGLKDGMMDIKKYFYVLRPLLAAQWICNKQTVPPMEFGPLLAQLVKDKELHAAIIELTRKKTEANEGDLTDKVPIIEDYIDSQIKTCAIKAKELLSEPRSNESLNQLFRDLLRENSRKKG